VIDGPTLTVHGPDYLDAMPLPDLKPDPACLL
jgi:hypothetical protein